MEYQVNYYDINKDLKLKRVGVFMICGLMYW